MGFTLGAAVLALALVSYHQRSRVIEGTWIDLFEGSRFFEDQVLSEACERAFRDGAWFEPPLDTEQGALVRGNRDSGVFISKYGTWPVAAYSVKFVGHHKIVGLGFGHMNGSRSEYVAERVLSIKPIPQPLCDTRPD